jgi:hypothetical protein
MEIHEFSWISMMRILNALRKLLSVRARSANAHAARKRGNEIIALAQAAVAVRRDRRSCEFVILLIFNILNRQRLASARFLSVF